MQRTETHFPARCVAVTPSDSDYFNPSTILVTVTGDVTVEPEAGGNTVAFTGVPAYFVIPFRVKRVLAATTATVVRVS